MMNPKSVPKPGSSSVQEALNLLVMMGSNNKAGAKLLNEMKCVQENNEKLLAEVKDAINQLTSAQAKLDRSQEKLDQDDTASRVTFASQSRDLLLQGNELEEKKKAFNLATKARLTDNKRRISELAARESLVTSRETATDLFHHQVEQRAKDADKRVAKSQELLNDLNKRDERLRKAMG